MDSVFGQLVFQNAGGGHGSGCNKDIQIGCAFVQPVDEDQGRLRLSYAGGVEPDELARGAVELRNTLLFMDAFGELLAFSKTIIKQTKKKVVRMTS